MELRHLRTFKAVAANRSFTQAAKELGYVQSAITAHVKTLEADLGVRLFDRLGRHIVLTEAGSELLAYATKILDLMDGDREAVAGNGKPSGTLHISASETLCIYRLPPVLEEFGKRFPEVLAWSSSRARTVRSIPRCGAGSRKARWMWRS
jgi:DNA-binding transcriptional LysR family regulator